MNQRNALSNRVEYYGEDHMFRESKLRALPLGFLVKLRKLELLPETGEYLTDLIKKIYATPKPIVDKISELMKQ